MFSLDFSESCVLIDGEDKKTGNLSLGFSENNVRTNHGDHNPLNSNWWEVTNKFCLIPILPLIELKLALIVSTFWHHDKYAFSRKLNSKLDHKNFFWLIKWWLNTFINYIVVPKLFQQSLTGLHMYKMNVSTLVRPKFCHHNCRHITILSINYINIGSKRSLLYQSQLNLSIVTYINIIKWHRSIMNVWNENYMQGDLFMSIFNWSSL